MRLPGVQRGRRRRRRPLGRGDRRHDRAARVVGWGGRASAATPTGSGAKLLAGILTNVLANQYALGLTAVERPVPAAGRGGLVCAHCGFASAHERAFYCPKCGMRLLRG